MPWPIALLLGLGLFSYLMWGLFLMLYLYEKNKED